LKNMTRRIFTMAHPTAYRLTGSALAICLATSGCSMLGSGARPANLTKAERPTTASQDQQARRAVADLLAKQDYAGALSAAEKQVALAPRDAEMRALLGQAYLLNGRYVSARAAYSDALSLGATDRRTIVSLAMIETALGHGEVARAILQDHASGLAAVDLGLALALAGDPAEGVQVLMRAIQDTGGDARMRQNLAYAQALAGDWTQARLVASRDLSSAEVQDRIARWAILSRPGNEALRVATLLGVDPRPDDRGLPANLALGPVRSTDPTAAGTSLAAMSPAQRADEPALPGQSAAPLFVAPLQAPATAAAPRRNVPRLATAPVATIRPVVAMAPAGQRLPASATAAFVRTSPAGKANFIAQSIPGKGSAAASKFISGSAPSPAASRAGGGNWAVQLGAFTDVTGAMVRWQQFAGRDAGLANLPLVASLVETNGTRLTRLSIKGFASRDAAMGLCSRLRAAGQACYPREGG
jgi:Flp pilus assembly protein TadD